MEEALIEMYLAGVSVRRVEDIAEALWGSKVSPSTISELNKKAYVHIEDWRCHRLKELAGKGKSAYSIGRELGVSKNTARKYITQPAQTHGLKGVRKGSKLDPYKPQLEIWMQQGIFNCVVLLERLRALGYSL